MKLEYGERVLSDKPFTGSPKQFEEFVKKSIEQFPWTRGPSKVVRCEDKKKDPDFFVAEPLEIGIAKYYYFVECKRYLKCSSVEEVVKLWKTKQPDQYNTW